MVPRSHPAIFSQKFSLTSALLVFSLVLNGLLLLRPPKHGQLLSDDNWKGMGWTRKAAEEAEAVSLQYQCSGHGYVFVDTFITDDNGSLACECNACYTGLDCSQFLPDCLANANEGDPIFLEPFWIANAEAAATVVPAWYRMSYDVKDGLEISLISPELEKQIRAIHELVGNAVTQGRYIVLGTGSLQLINAAVYSLSPFHAPNSSQVVSASPYYGAFRDQIEMFDSVESVWKGDARAWIKQTESLNSSTFIEFVTSPNNPKGILDESVLTGNNVRAVYDHAYYWPHYTGIPRPADEDVMLFTLSKLTGHAGSRLGWAIVKDYDVYKRMYMYVRVNTFGVSHDTQLRATRLLKAIINGYRQRQPKRLEDGQTNEKHLLFHYAYRVMRSRWQRVERIFSGSDRFSLQSLEPGNCTFFRRVTGPSPAYAWVKCEREEERECAGVFEKGGIIARNGKAFEADRRYVRLSLIKREDNFELLERRLRALVSSSAIVTY
ncbi:hypothetical protein SUGI_0131600 [Cryptomeria japonica]|uniref:tryptophan aminotransferase-related protein 3 n=1 Tax=Cryptomeria japonica TaxID=3369 RepID=UPI002408B41D|nr:tryptophan aminotransferase-related protein 3 [Cryptomeria japonica]GLJ10603.1 hypothetical protein SUGI_0131600 [Cryptomeria japonica]